MLSINHCRMHGKWAIRCCVPMVHLWIISQIETPRNIFNSFCWFDLRPLKIIIDETWKNLDEEAWVEKYVTVPQNNFKWKPSGMNDAVCIMSYGTKIWVPLIGVIGYIIYALAFVTRQLCGTQYVPKTLSLANFTGLWRINHTSKKWNVLNKTEKRFYY